MPFLSTKRNGTVTARSRLVQEGLISRYSTRFVLATISAKNCRFRTVVMVCMLSPIELRYPSD